MRALRKAAGQTKDKSQRQSCETPHHSTDRHVGVNGTTQSSGWFWSLDQAKLSALSAHTVCDDGMEPTDPNAAEGE